MSEVRDGAAIPSGGSPVASSRTSSGVVHGGAASSLPVASPRTARDAVAAIVAQRYRSPYARCQWCGAPCYGRSCWAHADLATIERESWAA